MRSPTPALRDEAVERFLGRVLQTGVTLAAGVATLGVVLFYVRHGGEPAAFGTFAPEPAALRSITAVFRDAAALRSRSMMQAGLVLLIATPIARVALSLVAFARQRDRLYVGVSSLVLALLLLSVAIGAA